MEAAFNNTDRDLTPREVNILLALAAGQMSGYSIVRQCQEDSADELRISNGTVFPALKRLEITGAIVESVAEVTTDKRSRRVFRITRAGRQMLEWQMATYRRMIRLGSERI